MGKNNVLLLIVVALLSFIGGFLLANGLNRKEISGLQADIQSLKNSAQSKKEDGLTPEELQRKIKEADDNQDDAVFQKNLGFALYRYASLKKDATLLPDVLRILKRADKDKKDFEVLSTIGNLLFDLAEIKNDQNSLSEAAGYYQDALKLRPNDEKVLQSFSECLLAQRKYQEAVEIVAKLKTVNPQNAKLSDFEKILAEQKAK